MKKDTNKIFQYVDIPNAIIKTIGSVFTIKNKTREKGNKFTSNI